METKDKMMKIIKNKKNVIKNLNVARNNYNQMLDKNNLSFKDMDNNINQISNKMNYRIACNKTLQAIKK